MRYYSRTEPVAYTFHASIYCAECGENLPEIDPEGNSKHPIASWETSDLFYLDDEGKNQWATCEQCDSRADEW